MSDATLYVPTDDGIGDCTLGFAMPLEYPNEDAFQPDYRAATLILERRGFGRSTFTLWERTESTNYHAWECVEREPGIHQLLADDDEPCADCVAEIASMDYDVTHDPDCPVAADPEAWDTLEGFYCCGDAAAADYNAHAELHAGRPSSVRGCTLHAEYVLLDGGDALCQYHLEDQLGRLVSIPHADAWDYDTRAETLDRYFTTRDDAGRDLGPTMPDVGVLWNLATLWRSARILESADRLRVTRDRTIGQLRDQVSQHAIAKHAGISQQRVQQIQRDAADTHNAILADLERRVAAEADANQ